jgi:hypothetical protein
MITKGQRDLFEKSIIAQHDDEDYSESGFVAVRVGDWCALAAYSHCSCYGTWASITGGGISDDEGPNDPDWTWEGTWEQLKNLAVRTADPAIPGRTAQPDDSDYDHLCEVYKQILSLSVNEAAHEEKAS